MKKLTALFSIAMLGLMLAVQGCNKDKNDDGDYAQILFEKQDYYPLEAALLNVENITFVDGEYEGSIDGIAQKLVATNGSLVTVIPDLSVGTHKLAVILNGREFSASFNLLASPAITDPNTVYNHYAQTTNSTLLNLIQFADSLEPVEKAQLLADIQSLQQYKDSVFQLYNALSPQEKENCARFLAANQWWLDELQVASSNILNSTFSFKTQDAIEDYEARVMQKFQNFLNNKVNAISSLKKIVALGTGAFLIASGGVPGIVVGALVIGYKFQAEIKPVIASLYELLNVKIQPYIDMVISAKTNSIITFNNDDYKQVTVTMPFRSIYAADANTSNPVVSNFVNTLRELKNLWNQLAKPVASLLNIKTVEDIPSFSSSAIQVNSKYLSVSNISNSKVTIEDVNRFDGYLKLKFKTAETTKQDFTFKINYNSDLGQKSSTVDAELDVTDSIQIYKDFLMSRNWRIDVCRSFIPNGEEVVRSYKIKFKQDNFVDSYFMDDTYNGEFSYGIFKGSGSSYDPNCEPQQYDENKFNLGLVFTYTMLGPGQVLIYSSDFRELDLNKTFYKSPYHGCDPYSPGDPYYVDYKEYVILRAQ